MNVIQNFVTSLEAAIGSKSTVVKYTAPPSYISCFGISEDIILIHRAESKKLIFKSAEEENNEETSILSEGDVTGHPLETTLNSGMSILNIVSPLEGHEILEEKGHLPLTLIQARNCLNLCNLKLIPPAPVWVLTDGNGPGKAVLISSFKANNWVTRSWAVDKGEISQMPTFEKLQKNHARLTYCQNPQVTCQIKSTYIIRNLSCNDDPQEFYSCTILQACWNTLKINPPLDKSTKITLITKCKIGSGSGGLLVLWRQLLLLQQYVEIIVARSRSNYGDSNITLPSCDLYLKALGKTRSEEKPLTRIRKILKEPIRRNVSSSNYTSLAEIIDLFTSSGRPGMDITDKIWYLFIECTSYQELSACFKQLLIELKKTASNVPYVSSSNISSLAGCLLGQVGGANILEPLEYLVEVGLEKLRKEILFIFSKSQIATLNSLNVPKLPKFSEVSSSDWMPTAQKWLLWCGQIQCALELLWNTQEAIFFQNNFLLTLTTNSLNIFTGSNSKIQSIEWLLQNTTQEIQTNVPMSAIEHRLGSTCSYPEQWILTLRTELEGKIVKSIFYRSLRSPFSHLSADSDLLTNTNISLLEKGNNYHWVELFTVSDEMNF